MLKRLLNLTRGFFGLFVSGIERKHPAALLELEKEHLRQQIVRYNEGLASHAGLCERLLLQVKRLQTEEKELRTKAAVNLRAGNRDAAGQYALRLQTVTGQLEAHEGQAVQAEATYRELVRARDAAVRGAQEKIEQLKYDLDDLKVKRATAELHEMASAMIGNLGGAGDNLSRLSALVDEEREKAAGRARVARDTLGTTGVHLQEAEQKATAEQALAEFAASEGIVLNLPAPGTPVEPASNPGLLGDKKD